MGQAESKLSYKNKVFMLAGSEDEEDDENAEFLIPFDSPYWNMYWEDATSADDVYSLLSYLDIKTIRDANKMNFLKLIRIVVTKLIKLTNDKAFPNNTTAQKKHMLNCIRVLNRLLPFLFEMTAWDKEINNLFWSIGLNSLGQDSGAHTGQATVGTFSVDSRGYSSLQSDSAKVNINVNLSQDPSSTKANVGDAGASRPLGLDLISGLVDLLFMKGFTLDSTGIKGTDYKMWEVGIGTGGKYSTPDPELDSNRLEVLRLVVTLVSQGMYQTPKTTVPNGSRFLTTLVSTTPRLKSLTLICSLLNIVCRSCKPDAENNGLSYSAPENNHQYSHQKFYALRKALVGYSLQLLTLMVVYPMPQQDIGFLHSLNMIPLDEKPHNMVRSYLGRLHKENELNFIYSSFLSLLLKPIQQAVDNEANPFNLLKNNFNSSPTSTATASSNGAFGSSLPGLSSWSTEIIILLWELIQCNKNFKAFVYGKKIQELMIISLYYIKFYRNDPLWRPSLVRIMCYFVLYLSSDPLVSVKLLSPFSSNYYNNMIPSFYKLTNQTLPSNLSYRDFLVLQICNMLVDDDFDLIITPSLFEYLYNLIPVKNTEPGFKGKTALSFHACLGLMNVIKKYSTNDSLKVPLKLDLLALVVRAIAQSVCRCQKESRTLLFVLARHERTITALLLAIQSGTSEDTSDEAIAPDQSVTTTTVNTPRTSTPDAESINEAGDQFDGDENDVPDPECEESLRPSPPTGMSSKAKSKLPIDAPLVKTWAGYRALIVILKVIKLVRNEVPVFSESSRAEVVETLIRIENIPDWDEKLSKFTPSEFLPKTNFEQLKFIWSTLSLGWYESILWGVIFYQNLSLSRESISSNWYKRSSTISLKDVASNWGFSWKSSKEKPVELFQFDSTILQLNIWNGTAVKLFKIKKPTNEKPLVDVTNLMKRFRLNSAASINAVEPRNSVTSLVRQNSHSGLNSPTQLTPINSRQSFGTPRNSVSAGTRESIYSLSRQNSYNYAA